MPKSFKCTNYNQSYAKPCDGALQTSWTTLDLSRLCLLFIVYATADEVRMWAGICESVIRVIFYLLSSICWMPGLVPGPGGRGRAGSGLYWLSLGTGDTRRRGLMARSQSDTCTPTITPSHRRFCHLVLVSTFSNVTKLLGNVRRTILALVRASELWWPCAYIKNYISEIKGVTCCT